LKGEGKLKAFENRVLKKIFGRETEEVAGDLGRLHNEHLLDFLFRFLVAKHYEIDQINEDKIPGDCSSNFSEENCMCVSVWKIRRKVIVNRT